MLYSTLMATRIQSLSYFLSPLLSFLRGSSNSTVIFQFMSTLIMLLLLLVALIHITGSTAQSCSETTDEFRINNRTINIININRNQIWNCVQNPKETVQNPKVTVRTEIGVCYGMSGDNIPPPSEVVALYNQTGISRMRLYNPNHQVLQALRGNNHIEVMLGVPNDELRILASSQAQANTWVNTNVLNFSKDVNFKYIAAVGNEVDPLNGNTTSQFLLPAMQNIHDALSSAGLVGRIKVSTPFDTSIIGASFPPSAGKFRPELGSFLNPIVEFLVYNSSPFLLNLYPYLSYMANTRDISIDYALFQASSVLVKDGTNMYRNLFDAMLDSVYSALERTGGGSVEIVVSESGWPTAGGTATSIENARIYNSNLIQHVKGGSPKRPGRAIETYIYAMIDRVPRLPSLRNILDCFYQTSNPSTQFILLRLCN